MASRLELQTKLESILGSKSVYFQPPATVSMSYPAVVYAIGTGAVKRADNMVYNFTNSYDVTFIYKVPNLDIIETMLSEFQMCRLSSSYCSDNLNHYVFNLYF